MQFWRLKFQNQEPVSGVDSHLPSVSSNGPSSVSTHAQRSLVPLPFSYKDTSSTGLGLLIISFNPNCLLQGPILHWGLGIQHINLGGHNSNLST